MQPFGLTKCINNYRNIKPNLLKTNAAIWFNKIYKQQLQKHQIQVIKNKYSHLV
jgi:hypothetical protein